MPNLTRRDLRAFLPGYNIPDAQADVTILLVSGWLQGALGVTDLPDPLEGRLWSAALELAALVVDNPTSRSQSTAGPTSKSWPMAPRRDAILADVRAMNPDRRGPTGSYPEPEPWPESTIIEVGAAQQSTGGWWWVEGSP